jgi:tetratricopeptide (TPR) repeat protein
MYNGQYQLAIDNYTKCLKLETDDAKKADAYYNRGTVYVMGLENYTAAIADYTSAIRIEPDAADAYYNRGLSYAKLENYTAAIADYTSAIRIEPDYADAYNNRGNQYEKLENYTAAIADYTSAIRINPEYALAYKNRGIAKENAGQSSCSDYKRACDLEDEECCEWFNDQCK